MNPAPARPLWLRKRFLLPVALLLGLVTAGVFAFLTSDVSSIVIYNQTGAPLPPLLVRACEQEHAFPTLPEQGSVMFELKPRGPETLVRLELATDPPWQWEGPSIRPRGGGHMTIRLWPGGQVEAYSAVSWWRRMLE